MAFPTEFTKRWINRTKDKFMFSVNINKLTKDELLASLAFLIQKEDEDRKRRNSRYAI